MQGKHPVVDLLLEYRELSKLKSTYLDALPEQVNPHTGRVHTSYNQAGSCHWSDCFIRPKPSKHSHPHRAWAAGPPGIYRCTRASPYYQWITRKWSCALLPTCPTIKPCWRHSAPDQDIHTATAAAILGKTLDQVTKDERRNAKAINFGLLYGMSAFGLTRSSDLTLAEAEDFVEAYFQQFPGVKGYLDNMRRLAAKQGYVETLLGRTTLFPRVKIWW